MLARHTLAGQLLALALLVPACNGGTDTDTDDTDDTDTGTSEAPASYEFQSRFTDGSSVAYSGQVLRHVLIHDLKTHLGKLTDRLDSGLLFPEPGDVEAELDFYFSFDSDTSGSVSHLVSTDPAPAQETYGEIGSADLVGKIAGNDPGGQHEDWSTAFVGWPHEEVTTPESLVRLWFSEIDAAAVEWANGNVPTGPDGEPVPAVYVTEDGRDLQQLLQKFLLGAIAFSQGADDYLDDGDEGKGILSSNAEAEEGKAYTALEHQWDEGFGYFGASRTYGSWDDDFIKGTGHADDFEEDGAIDLSAEYAWGHSQNAAKRDLGAADSAPTDMTAEAWEAFLLGRKLISDAGGELDEYQLAELQGYRDQAVLAWEEAIAATVVHYINDTLQDMGTFGTDDYSFGDHAKHWSEMKGFALSFQFNPRSPLSDEAFEELHELLGTHPTLPDASEEAIAQYADDLRTARALLGDAYGFDDANLGDDDGENGW